MVATQWDFFAPTPEQEYRRWRETETGRKVLGEMIRLAIGDKRAGMWRSHKRLLEDIRGSFQAEGEEEWAIPNGFMRYLALDAMDHCEELRGWFRMGSPRPRKDRPVKRIVTVRELAPVGAAESMAHSA